MLQCAFTNPTCTDNKSVEPAKSPHVEKVDNSHKPLEKLESGHKQLEKSESGHKLVEKTESEPKLTPVGVDSVTKPLDPGPTKVTIGSQTSMDHELQSDQIDSPPLSPPVATASGVSK